MWAPEPWAWIVLAVRQEESLQVGGAWPVFWASRRAEGCAGLSGTLWRVH